MVLECISSLFWMNFELLSIISQHARQTVRNVHACRTVDKYRLTFKKFSDAVPSSRLIIGDHI